MGVLDGETTPGVDIKVVVPLSVVGRILQVSASTLDYWSVPVIKPEGLFRCMEWRELTSFLEAKVAVTSGKTREMWRRRVRTLARVRFRDGYFVPAVGMDGE